MKESPTDGATPLYASELQSKDNRAKNEQSLKNELKFRLIFRIYLKTIIKRRKLDKV